ncbi:MAG: IS5 family transposase [Candidatus Thiodiazotropha sp.]
MERYRKPTRREKFFAEIDGVVPWHQLCEVTEPYYPKAGNGRPPVGLERMLRIYLLQHWFNLSDPGAEEALYESRSMYRFAGIDLRRELVPDETTILKFRHLLNKLRLGNQLFQAVGEYLQTQGMKVATGTIVDASIINAPSSTKNMDKQRDPEMHKTKKGNQWYFGMKAHIGVDSKTKIIHSVAATPANVHDSQLLEDLLHGDETHIWGDSAYTGQGEDIQSAAPKAKDFTQAKGCRHKPLTEVDRLRNRIKSRVRAKVEHVFGVMKRVFGFTKVRYRGYVKNAHALFVLSALTNLYLVRRRLSCVAHV